MSKYCMGCMEQYGDEFNVCPYCGFVEGTKAEQGVHMEPGSILAGRYIVGKVLGSGGFGVTYIGWDALLENKVAIKEYLPSEFSTRMPGVTQVTVYNGDKKEQFQDGLKQFINEAKRLARLSNIEGIVRVYDAVEENNTAYIVMEYLEGETLGARLEREKTIAPEEAVQMLLPVIDALEEVHKYGILHRDLAPDNLFIQKDGTVKVIDFGAARFATTAHSRSLTVIIKPGYSAEEQYRSRADQGSYTDVYSMGAILYKMITGITPPDALERRAQAENSNKDILLPISKYCKGISKNRENAILNAMNIRVEDRTKTMEALASQLRSENPVALVVGKIRKTTTYRWPLWAKLSAGIAILAVVVFGVLFGTGVIGFDSNLQTEISIPADMTRVPSVINNSTEQAGARMEEAFLLYAIAGKEYSTQIPADYVLEQDVDGGTIVMQNTMINLIISGGPQMVMMPDVRDMYSEDAILLLQEEGFTVEISGAFSNAVALGNIISQDTEPLSDIAMGSTVHLVVSKGTDPADLPEQREFQVPDLIGKSFEEVLAIAEEEAFLIRVEERQYSAQQPAGAVLSQTPAKGETIGTGDAVTLILSMGSEKTRVPDVQFLPVEEAIAALEAEKLAVTESYEYSESVASGLVISQNPAGNAVVEPGAMVSIVISKGGKPFSMPDVVGMTEDEAKKTLNDLGITVTVNYEYSDEKESKTVLAQDISAGDEVVRGAEVTLTVSNGEKPVPVPSVIGMDTESAKAALDEAGFKSTLNWTYSDNVGYGKVITQSPGGDTSQTKGTTIVLTASLGRDTVQSISILNLPAKRGYYVGAKLDTTGLTIGVTYKSGKTREITNGFSCSPTTLDTEGTNTITVTYEGAATTFTVSAKRRVPESISVTTNSDTLYYSDLESDSCTLTAAVKPDGGNITWTSSNTGVATVSGSGKTATVNAVSEGTATITATYTLNGESMSDSCTITVAKAASTGRIENFDYCRSGTVDEFYVSGTIKSNYALDRVVLNGTGTSLALNITIKGYETTYEFPPNTYSFECSELRDFFMSEVQYLIDMYPLYSAITSLVGGEDTIRMELSVTGYDSSGFSMTVPLVYDLHYKS